MSDETQKMTDADLDQWANENAHWHPLWAEARRARRREAEQDAVLARIVEAVAGWGHIEGCDRMGECDERVSGEECMYHGDEACPGCECGKGEILGILAAPEGKKADGWRCSKHNVFVPGCADCDADWTALHAAPEGK